MSRCLLPVIMARVLLWLWNTFRRLSDRILALKWLRVILSSMSAGVCYHNHAICNHFTLTFKKSSLLSLGFRDKLKENLKPGLRKPSGFFCQWAGSRWCDDAAPRAVWRWENCWSFGCKGGQQHCRHKTAPVLADVQDNANYWRK